MLTVPRHIWPSPNNAFSTLLVAQAMQILPKVSRKLAKVSMELVARRQAEKNPEAILVDNDYKTIMVVF